MAHRRWLDMLRRLLLIYAIVELAVIVALVATIGWGWTLLILLASFVLGWGFLAPLAGSHLIHRIGQLRSGLTEPQSAVNDGALVTLAAALVLIPGLVSTAVGLLLLVPPVRSVARPGLTYIAVRGFQSFAGRVPLISYATVSRTESYSGDGRDYIDGEVIDVVDFEPPALPHT